MSDEAPPRRIAALRDPMSKTLVIASIGIISLTVIALTVIVGAIRSQTLSDGAMVGLIGTIVGGISTCVTAVSSRAQGQAPPAKSGPAP